MTPQQFIGVAVRLFAIWLVMSSLQIISTGIALHLLPDTQDTVVAYLFAGLYLIVAAILWFFPMFVAHRLIPRTRYEEALSIPAQQVTVVATVVLGLWLLAVRAIPAIVLYATLGAFWSRNGQTLSTLPQKQHVEFVVGVIELVVALVLMFKAPRISTFILTKHQDSEAE